MPQIKKIWNHLSKHRQKQFGLLLLLMIFGSLAEVISMGAVLPFLGVLTSPKEFYQHPLMQPIIQFLQLTAPSQLLLPLTITFILAALLAGIIRITLLYTMTRLSFSTGADISINIYRRTLYQEYSIHVGRNSSEVINGIISKTSIVIHNIINPILIFISSMFLIIAIISALFSINIQATVIAFIGFGILYWGVIRFTRQHLKKNSECIAKQSTQIIKALQEGLGGIRDVLINGSQQFYCQLYRNADMPLRRAQWNNIFISGSPRFAMEAVGMTLIAYLAYTMSLKEEGLQTAIPVLGALTLGSLRLLPALHLSYSAYSNIKGSFSSFKDVLDLLDQPMPSFAKQPLPTPINFKKHINLKNISFNYTADKQGILNKINLKIIKGSRVGFVGKTGSGKSTLLDIIMGLLFPTEGILFIDNQPITVENYRKWQMHVAHVPQNIYLADSTIEENIAIGIPKEEIDQKQILKVAKQAHIAGLIDSWPDKYQTFVGERGIRISGGQRQRLGIARALYKQADVLIFDEATSALDNETEQAVMEAIQDLDRDLTILIIAHRLTTLKGCDLIAKLDENGILHVEKYNEMIA